MIRAAYNEDRNITTVCKMQNISLRKLAQSCQVKKRILKKEAHDVC